MKEQSLAKSMVMGLLVALVYWCSQGAHAGIFMGSSAKTPVSQNPNNLTVQQISVPFASVPVAATAQSVNCEPFVGKGPMPANPCPPSAAATIIKQPMVVTVHTGSLKSNIERITKQAGWGNPVWKLNYDYNWLGNVTITADDVQGVLTKLLEPYPLQAVFYNANHVVAIVPRRNT